MDLLKATQRGSLEVMEKAVKSQETWSDYEALNNALANGNTDKAKFLLKRNCRVNKPIATNILESTPLHKAVKLKDRDLTKLLLQSGASITAAYEGGNTPLHLAFIAGLTDVVNLMVKYIGLILEFTNCKNDVSLSHLHIACTTENSEVIEKYLTTNVNIQDTVSKDSPNWAGYTAYHFAIKYRSLAAINNLSRSTLDDQIIQKDKDGQTPHDLACARLVEHSIMMHALSKHKDKRSYYFQGQSDVPKCEIVDQPTAFHLACMRDDSHLIKTFIHHGAPVNIPVSEEMSLCPLYSPLHFAVESGCEENVELLLEYGADLTQTNGYKMTALHLAMYNEKSEWRTSRLVNLLYSRLENKEENLMDDNQLSYFHIAVAINDLKLVKKMLKGNQVDVNSQVLANHREFSLYTPLHFAVQFHNQEMVKLLVEHGADRNAVSSRGTALEIAFIVKPCEYNFHMFELLLDICPKADPAVGKQTLMHQIIHQAMSFEVESTNPIDRYYGDPWSVLQYIERVIELGYDVNAQDKNGNTALHFACGHHSNLCVTYLLENGADINIENNEGECVTLFPFYHYKAEDAVMYHHLQNLKALGWRVNPKLEENCDEPLNKWLTANPNEDVRYDEYCQYARREAVGDDRYTKQKRLDEINWKRRCDIKIIKDTKIDEKTSLYEFMRLEGEETGAYARNEKLKRMVDLGGRRSMFWYLIELQYRRSQENARQSTANEDTAKIRFKRKRAQ